MEERRRAQDEQIGYLTAKMQGMEELMRTRDEDIIRRLDDLHERFFTHVEQEEARQKNIEAFISKMETRITVRKALWAVAKSVGAVLLLIGTIKWGDIPSAFIEHLTGHLGE